MERHPMNTYGLFPITPHVASMLAFSTTCPLFVFPAPYRRPRVSDAGGLGPSSHHHHLCNRPRTTDLQRTASTTANSFHRSHFHEPAFSWIARKGVSSPSSSSVHMSMSSFPQSPPPQPAHRPFIARALSSLLAFVLRLIADDTRDLAVDVDAVSNADLLQGRIREAHLSATRIVIGGAPVSGGFVARLTSPIDLGRILSPPASVHASGTRPERTSNGPFAISVHAVVTEADLNVRQGVWFVALQSLLRDCVKFSLDSTAASTFTSRQSPQTDLECVTLSVPEVSATRPYKPSPAAAMAATAASFISAALWNMVAPGQPLPELPRSTGKIVLHARTKLADGTLWTYKVQSRLALSEQGTLLEFDQPELVWRGIGLPVLTLAKAAFKLNDTTIITALEITQDGLSIDGLLVVDLAGKISGLSRALRG